jgi:hypothetical protein
VPLPRSAETAAITRPSWTSSTPIDDSLGGGGRDPDVHRAPRGPAPNDVTGPVAVDLEFDDRAGRDEGPAGPDRGGPGRERQRSRRVQPGVRPDRTERHLGRHLVRAADDGQAVAARQEPVPLADRGPVGARRQGLELDRVDPPIDDVGRDLRVRQREVDGDREPVLRVRGVRPVAHQPFERVAHPRLGRPRARHRQHASAAPSSPM